MPWLEFIQPWRPQISQSEPERWQFRMQRPDEEGWPSDEAFMSQLDEMFYFDCDLAEVQEWCYDYTIEDYGEWPPQQWRIDQCISDNVSRCAQVLTEDYPYENGWVQARACDVNEVSCGAWSEPLIVPESPVGLALFVGLIALAALARFRP